LGDLIQIDAKIFTILGISIPILSVLGYLVHKYISHRLEVSRDNATAFRSAYGIFRKAFSHTIQQLETGDTTLNLLILGDFLEHDLAMKDFIHNLRGFRKTRFLEKWEEYENKYYEIKNLGVLGFTTAIAPTIEELNNYTPRDMERWEHNRSKELYKLIHDLLSISSKKCRF